MSEYARRVVAVAAAMLCAATLPVVTTADAAMEPETCKGRPVTISGTDDDDTLDGTSGDDVIRAYAGDDVVHGRGGDDVICGDSGADELYGDEGDDALHGGPYRLYSDDGAYAAEGDVLAGGAGNDRIFGGGRPSNEAVRVSPARHTPDRVEFPGAKSGITITADGVVTGRGIGRDQIFEMQHVVGTRWADDITVHGDVIVSGGSGPDRVTVLPGAEDQTLYPTLYGDAGDDRLDLSQADAEGYWLYGGDGDDTLLGSKYADHIGDHEGAGEVDAGGGDDQIDTTSLMTVLAGGGDDSLQIALESGAREPIDGGPGEDHAELQNATSAPLSINVPDRVLRADGESSDLTGIESFGASAREADVRFVGGPGDERLGVVAWNGNTVRARMGAGDDEFVAYAAIDPDDYGAVMAWGGPGDDVFDGAESDDSLFGEGGDDVMYGDSGDDVIRGGPGDDRAYGSRGDGDSCTGEVESECEE